MLLFSCYLRSAELGPEGGIESSPPKPASATHSQVQVSDSVTDEEAGSDLKTNA